MSRLLPVVAVAVTLSSAFALYGIKYETRRLELEVQARERDAERARSDIAVLKAERALLGRPERIEPLAQALGLRPPAAGQFARIDEPRRAADPQAQQSQPDQR